MNYSAEAIDSLKRIKGDCEFKNVLQTIEHSVKFDMTEGELLTRDIPDYSKASIRLPYDKLSIELMVRVGNSFTDSVLIPSVFTYEKSKNGIITSRAFKSKGMWSLDSTLYLMLGRTVGEFDVKPKIIMNGERHRDDECILVASLVMKALLILNSILDCSNIEAVTVEPRIKSQWGKRKKKLNRFEYKELVIKESRSNRVSDHESEHANVCRRGHLRRGHIRNHPTAGKIWINACAVSGTGFIKKDYRITQ